MKPLKELNLFDTILKIHDFDDPRSFTVPPKIMNEDIFDALREKHSDSIVHLTIRSSYILKPDVLQAMLSFIESATALPTLSLRLIDADISNLERLS